MLAGAGVVGLAVGFGAQTLVKDIITGVFILVEDAVAVGDVVNVAGIGGLVEDMSIRSIRLRDLSGNVHTVPFSSVDTVTNMTKDFSYYLLDIAVAYREDTDEVARSAARSSTRCAPTRSSAGHPGAAGGAGRRSVRRLGGDRQGPDQDHGRSSSGRSAASSTAG